MSTTTSVSMRAGAGYDFDGMDRDLQGRSKVVVSKGTLAKVSRQHSQILRQLVLDMSMSKSHIKKIQDDWAIVDDLQVCCVAWRCAAATRGARSTWSTQHACVQGAAGGGGAAVPLLLGGSACAARVQQMLEWWVGSSCGG